MRLLASQSQKIKASPLMLSLWHSLRSKVSIFGVQLQPFTMGHYFILQTCDCAFLRADCRLENLFDLVLGIAVCSREGDFQEWVLNQTDFKCWFQELILQLRRRAKNYDPLQEATKFKAYVAQGLDDLTPMDTLKGMHLWPVLNFKSM